MEMGQKIYNLRIQKGLTLEELGNMVGVGKSTVRKWENGMIANMKRDNILKVSEVLDTTPAYLMGWKEDPPKEGSPKIMQYYNQLNNIGKHEAEKRVEELTHLSKYTKEGENNNNTVKLSEKLNPTKDYLLPNAAHADESLSEITEEMILAEEDIMDDENF